MTAKRRLLKKKKGKQKKKNHSRKQSGELEKGKKSRVFKKWEKDQKEGSWIRIKIKRTDKTDKRKALEKTGI